MTYKFMVLRTIHVFTLYTLLLACHKNKRAFIVLFNQCSSKGKNRAGHKTKRRRCEALGCVWKLKLVVWNCYFQHSKSCLSFTCMKNYFLHYLRKAISLTVSRSADVHSNAFKGVCFSGPLFVLLLQFCPTIALTMHVFDV